jgi:hypothetical protein
MDIPATTQRQCPAKKAINGHQALVKAGNAETMTEPKRKSAVPNHFIGSLVLFVTHSSYISLTRAALCYTPVKDRPAPALRNVLDKFPVLRRRI